VSLKLGSGFPETQNDSSTSSRFYSLSDTCGVRDMKIISVATSPNNTIAAKTKAKIATVSEENLVTNSAQNIINI